MLFYATCNTMLILFSICILLIPADPFEKLLLMPILTNKGSLLISMFHEGPLTFIEPFLIIEKIL